MSFDVMNVWAGYSLEIAFKRMNAGVKVLCCYDNFLSVGFQEPGDG